MLAKCPSCHKLSSHALLTKELIDQSKVAKVTGYPEGRAALTSSGISWTAGTDQGKALQEANKEEGQEGTLTYRLTFKCDKCGSTWEKLENEKVTVPQDYLDLEFRE